MLTFTLLFFLSFVYAAGAHVSKVLLDTLIEDADMPLWPAQPVRYWAAIALWPFAWAIFLVALQIDERF